MPILFVCESPGKIKKISSFLGSDFLVKASMGHFRDLNPKEISIDFEHNFDPVYIITKPSVVKDLKSAMKNCSMVYIASDNGIEGHAIAQSIYEVLRPKQYKRLLFNAITKKDIMTAIKNAGVIDKKLVDAQKARRVLDRLYGYLISPILQRQIGGALSAGRVQSVAAEIIIEKEREIKNFLEKNSGSTFFKVHGIFSALKAVLYESADKKPYMLDKAYKGDIAKILLADDNNPSKNTTLFLKKCLKSEFIVHAIFDRLATRSPAPPFTTSTLQQEANRKFGMSVDQTMKTAQKLYEGGYITYMRTDSVDISEEGHKGIKKVIEKEYGKEYYQKNIYKTKSSNAQEAHEAIRPTHPELLSLEKEIDDKYQIKLYKLIWQRTIASQMKPAQIKVFSMQINISQYVNNKLEPYYYFQSQIEENIFEGFMKVYVESVDDADEENLTSKTEQLSIFKKLKCKVGDKLNMNEIIAKQEYLRPPPRYTEASLVKKLEALGIGRPSTYANTVKTIQLREYIKVDNIAGIKKDIVTYSIKSNKNKPTMEIYEDKSSILLGKETKKLVPTNLGITVNDYLLENFPEMMDYKFTAKMEAELDAVANGTKVWYKIVQKFYDKLNPIIIKLSKNKSIVSSNEKLLGADKNGVEIFATKTKYGPVVKKMVDGKFIYASIGDSLKLDTIKLKDAIALLKEREEMSTYPKKIGKYEKKDVTLNKGKFGFYITYDGDNYSFPAEIKSECTLDEAIQLIKSKKANSIAEFEITENKKKIKAIILNGKYGPYIMVKRGKTRTNYPIYGKVDPTKLTKEQVAEIISKKKPTGNKPGKKKMSGSKTAKKIVPKKQISKNK